MNHQLEKLDPKNVEIVQSRVAISWTTIEEYAHDMREGATFPPIRVRYDGEKYWCGDGCHRIHAARQAGQTVILASVAPGDRRAAILDAAGANADHGLRRSNEDKRRAVQMLLDDEEWAQWSNREIARRCHIDEKPVRRMRSDLTAAKPQLERTYVTKHGTTATMNTANIGHAKSQRAAFDPSAPREQRISVAIKHLLTANRPLALTILRRYGALNGDTKLNVVLEYIRTGKYDTVQKAIVALGAISPSTRSTPFPEVIPSALTRNPDEPQRNRRANFARRCFLEQNSNP